MEKERYSDLVISFCVGALLMATVIWLFILSAPVQVKEVQLPCKDINAASVAKAEDKNIVCESGVCCNLKTQKAVNTKVWELSGKALSDSDYNILLANAKKKCKDANREFSELQTSTMRVEPYGAPAQCQNTRTTFSNAVRCVGQACEKVYAPDGNFTSKCVDDYKYFRIYPVDDMNADWIYTWCYNGDCRQYVGGGGGW